MFKEDSFIDGFQSYYLGNVHGDDLTLLYDQYVTHYLSYSSLKDCELIVSLYGTEEDIQEFKETKHNITSAKIITSYILTENLYDKAIEYVGDDEDE